MQTLFSHWDTSGDHLAPASCVVDFAYWWHDACAQQIVTDLIACCNEIGVGDPLATADAELATIYNDYVSELRYDDSDEGYIDDLIYDTATADCVAENPWKYCLAGGVA